jgi:hypothetical protein
VPSSKDEVVTFSFSEDAASEMDRLHEQEEAAVAEFAASNNGAGGNGAATGGGGGGGGGGSSTRATQLSSKQEAIALDAAEVGRCGAKAAACRRLAEIGAAHGFLAPAGACIPFGVMQVALQALRHMALHRPNLRPMGEIPGAIELLISLVEVRGKACQPHKPSLIDSPTVCDKCSDVRIQLWLQNPTKTQCLVCATDIHTLLVAHVLVVHSHHSLQSFHFDCLAPQSPSVQRFQIISCAGISSDCLILIFFTYYRGCKRVRITSHQAATKRH